MPENAIKDTNSPKPPDPGPSMSLDDFLPILDKAIQESAVLRKDILELQEEIHD